MMPKPAGCVPDLGVSGEVAGQHLGAELARERLERFDAPAAQDEARPALRERTCNRLTEAAARAGEKDSRTVELHGRHLLTAA